MKLKVKKLHPAANLPTYATAGAARFDISFTTIKDIKPSSRTVVFGTGLAFEVPDGWEMVIVGRSGYGFQHNIRLANCEGIIDSDYRGEVMLALHADTEAGYKQLLEFTESDVPLRIAQCKLQRAPQIEFELVEELGSSVRGADGLGSTGND